MRRAVWIGPIAWMLLILWLGSDGASAERTGRLIVPALRYLFPAASPVQLEWMHAIVRKLAHVTEYAVLTALWIWALTTTRETAARRAAWHAWLITIAWATIDEAHQSMVVSRTASAWDVALDGFGGLLVALPATYRWQQSVNVLTKFALWTAALAGTALLVVDASVGVSSGILWLVVPASVVVLLLARRLRR